MKWYSWVWRGLIAVFGLLVAASVSVSFYLILAGKTRVTPLMASDLMFDVWMISWIIAALWSKPATSHPPALDGLLHWTPTLVGFLLLSFGSAAPIPGDRMFLHLPSALAWILTGVCAAGLLFTWWARISLGALWSGSVSRKDDHTVVQSGPYRLVRHPIYTGLILAALVLGAQVGMLSNFAGALLIALGLWLKARLEERFLSRELGPAAYADYRRRTPMLIPFWPA